MQELSENIANEELMIETSELVYATPNIGIYQNDSRASFILCIQGDEIELKLCAVLAFRKKINSLDINQLIETSHPGIEIIPLPHSDRFFIFSIQEILELRDLFAGTITMLELNSMIHQQLVRPLH